MKAWLITWDWIGDAAAVADIVVGVLNPRWSDKRVAEIVEFLYANATANVAELSHYAKKPSNNPYRAEIRNGTIHCGSNPFLYARVVSDLRIETTINNKETISWMEPPRYELINNRVEMVKNPFPGKFTRRISGPVSHKEIWDRATSKFKKGFGPGELPEEDW